MATVQRRTNKDGSYSYKVEVRKKGFPPQRATFKRKTDANKWARQTESAIEEGRYFKTTEARKHTLSDAINRYKKSVLPEKKDSRKQGAQLDWWRDNLGAYTLADITPALLGEARDDLAKTRSPATVVRYLAALSHVFTIAVNEWGWLEDNPIRKVRKPKEPKGRNRYLTEDEIPALLEACNNSSNPYLHTIVVLALSTGMRQGEILNLRWPDVNLDDGRITLRDTKNGETRTVPLAGRALDSLREHSKVRRLDTDLLFPGRRCDSPVFIRAPWSAAVEASGIKNFRFHDLRHSAASYLAMNGASVNLIAKILGHKSIQVTNRYTHLSEEYAADAVTRMNERFLK